MCSKLSSVSPPRRQLDSVTTRFFAYALITQVAQVGLYRPRSFCSSALSHPTLPPAQVFYSWICAYAVPGNDAWSVRVMFFVGASQPLVTLSLQLSRFVLYPSESRPGNVVFVSDIYTALVVTFVCEYAAGWQLGEGEVD